MNIQTIVIFLVVLLVFYDFFVKINNNSKIIDYAYYSFDGSNKANPKNSYHPTSLEEIQQIIKDSKGRKIRVSGGRHTFNDISISNDIILRTDKLNKVLNLDKKKKQITVQSGITLRELNIFLEDNNFALSVLPAIAAQTVGGILGTSTHGSRYNFGSMGSMLVDVTLVKSDGTIIKIGKTNSMFKALSANLGCLGAVYSITLQCEDLFAIKHISTKIKIVDFINNYKDLQKKYEFLQAYLYPFSKDQTCTVYYRERVNLNLSNNKDKDMIKELSKKNTNSNKIDFSHKILTKNLESDKLYTEIEVAVPIKYFKEAINDVLKLIRDYKKKYNYNTEYSILIRFTKSDKNSLLSMVSDRDSFFIDTFNKASLNNDPLLNKYFKEFHDMLINKYSGRPHYGKKHFLTNNQMKKVYGTKVDQFNTIRKKLDPSGMFSNNYIYRLLGN